MSASPTATVADVLVRYATAIDRRDWELFRSCFTDDCDADYGPIGHWDGVDALADWMQRAHAPAGPTMHRITNVAVDGDEADDRVTARCYVEAIVLARDGAAGSRANGYYDDELVRTADGWRITRRRFTMVLLELVPDGTVVDVATFVSDRSR